MPRVENVAKESLSVTKVRRKLEELCQDNSSFSLPTLSPPSLDPFPRLSAKHAPASHSPTVEKIRKKIEQEYFSQRKTLSEK